MNEKLELYTYKNLQEAGFGNRSTVMRKVKNSTFPAPADNGTGKPVWTREMIDQYINSLQKHINKPVAWLHARENQQG